MVINLDTVRLNSGEDAEIYQIIAPQPDWKTRLLRRLCHKGDLWEAPMTQALDRGLEGMTMSFFVIELDEELVGNITTVEALDRPVGLLQHVYTDPDHRRKGVCSQLMTTVCDEFQSNEGRAMYLGTGYDTAPFWIYYDYGFRPIGETGSMVWAADGEFPENYFTTSEVCVRESIWGDWPLLNALYETEGGWRLRGYVYGQFEHSSYEAAFCKLQRAIENGEARYSRVLQLEDTGAIVGHAFVGRDSRWPGGPWVLDFFVHRDYVQHTSELLDAVNVPVGERIQCFADAADDERIAAIEAFGFQQQAFLSHQYQDTEGHMRDAIIYRMES